MKSFTCPQGMPPLSLPWTSPPPFVFAWWGLHPSTTPRIMLGDSSWQLQGSNLALQQAKPVRYLLTYLPGPSPSALTLAPGHA